MMKYQIQMLGVLYGLALCLRMVLRSVSGPHRVLDHEEGPNLRTMVNSELWMGKLLYKRIEMFGGIPNS